MANKSLTRLHVSVASYKLESCKLNNKLQRSAITNNYELRHKVNNLRFHVYTFTRI